MQCTQGQDPGWDPLGFLCAEAHARNIEVHAWLNPYRAAASAGAALAAPHIALQAPEHAHVYNGGLWMDPGALEVREHNVDVALDIVAITRSMEFTSTTTSILIPMLAKADWRRQRQCAGRGAPRRIVRQRPGCCSNGGPASISAGSTRTRTRWAICSSRSSRCSRHARHQRRAPPGLLRPAGFDSAAGRATR